MKGTCFQKPFEFSLVVEGESWHQGDTIQGRLGIKNYGGGDEKLKDVFVSLAHGEYKNVKLKKLESFEILKTAEISAEKMLSSGEKQEIEWAFHLDQNAPVTDKSSSLYLLYGKKQDGMISGHLQIRPPARRSFFDFFESYAAPFFTYFIFDSLFCICQTGFVSRHLLLDALLIFS